MKSKFLVLLLLLAIVISTLAACGGNGDGGNGDEGGAGDNTPPTVSTIDIKSIIYGGVLPSDVDIRSIINSYQSLTGTRLSSSMDVNAEEAKGEILLGSTNRQLSTSAERQLMRSIKLSSEQEWDSVSYLIYVKNGSVAVVWDNDIFANAAIEQLVKYLTSEEPVLVNGFKEFKTVRTNAEKEALEQQKREDAIAAVRDKLGADAADAVRAHLALFDDRFYMWIADLYEPRTCICDNYDAEGYRMCLFPKDEDGNYICHGGGFYYSNSGRDNVGYDIDIESTIQAINFLSSSGMLADYGNSTKLGLPQQMRNDIACYAKSLQSPDDGYFYHPQWGTSVGTSRIGRDLGWATTGLDLAGLKPFWDTPNGRKGELGAPGKNAVTTNITESTVEAVSKVEAAASVWPAHLKTLDAFKTYMAGFNLADSSYSAGNTLSSQAGQINQRDKEGIESGEFKDENNDGIADNGFVKAFEEYFNSKQNPENGLWQDSVHYNSVNGLMKIGSAYNSLNIKLPHAVEAFYSAVEMASLDPDTADIKGKKATGSVDVYNPWVAMAQVISNINKHGDKTESAALKTAMQEKAAEMIRITTAKVKKFAKEDGSYGYTWTTSPANSQGAPVAVPGTVEGDINGGCIALRGVWGNMTSVLGISVPLYYPSDYDKFLYRINQLDPVIKHNAVVEVTKDPIDFSGESDGSTVADRVSVSTNNGGGMVAKDPTNSKNLVFKLYNEPSTVTGTTLAVIPALDKKTNCNILQWDMYVESAKNTSTAFQVRVGDGYMFTIGFADGKVTFGDSSSTGSGVKNTFPGKVNFKEWHRVRIEYYSAGDGVSEGPKTKIYVDDVLIGISDNYFGKEQASKKPSNGFNQPKFYALQSTTLVVYFDNILAIQETKEYKAEEIGNIGDGSNPGGGVDPTPTSKYGKYDFEAENDGVTTHAQADLEGVKFEYVKDPKDAANKVLCVTTVPAKTKGTGVHYKVNENVPEKGNCYVFEFDIEVDATHKQKNFTTQLYISNGTSTNISTVNLNFKYTEALGYTLSSIQARHNGASTSGASSGDIAKDILLNGRCTIRMEYYKDNGMCKIYVNDKFVGERINYWSEANSKLDFTIARFYCTYSTDARFYFDNVTAEVIEKAYVEGAPSAVTPTPAT